MWEKSVIERQRREVTSIRRSSIAEFNIGIRPLQNSSKRSDFPQRSTGELIVNERSSDEEKLDFGGYRGLGLWKFKRVK